MVVAFFSPVRSCVFMLELSDDGPAAAQTFDWRCASCKKLDLSLDSNPMSVDNFELELGDIKLEAMSPVGKRSKAFVI